MKRRRRARAAATGDAGQDARKLFAAEVSALALELPNVTRASFHPAGQYALLLESPNGLTHVLFLENLFADTREMPPEHRSRYLSTTLSAFASFDCIADIGWEEAAKKLIPLVRPATFAGIDPNAWPVRRPFAPFVHEVLGIDLPTSTAMLPPAVLARWGVTADEAFAAAERNLAAGVRDEDVEVYDMHGQSAIWHLANDDDYQTSRLLLPHWLASFEPRVAGRPVAIVPTRTQLLVAGDGNESVLRRLVEKTRREYAASNRSVSPVVYTVDESGAVVPLSVPVGHPVAHELKLNQLLFAQDEYRRQKADLDARHAESNTNAFAAEFMIGQRPGHMPTSFCACMLGSKSLLPRTDYVFIGSVGAAPIVVPWESLQQFGTELLERVPNTEPERYETARAPSDKVLELLRAASTVL